MDTHSFSSFDIVAIVASAGGLEALSVVLRGLSPELPVAVIVAQHLGGHGSSLADILRRRTRLPVSWAEDGAQIIPGTILVAPPRKRLEVLPDRTFAVGLDDVSASARPLDSLLNSLADSLGPRVIGVVLTGMGKDGSAGARKLKDAGGTVLVQSEETAEAPSMPHAAIQNGAADLVLPLFEIGPMIADLVAGARLPKARSEIEAAETLFRGPGEVRQLARVMDWSATPVGPVINWPMEFRLMVRTTLDSASMMAVWWGPQFIQIYNDRWRKLLGVTKHPQALGGRAQETWPEIWHNIGPMVERVMTLGEAVGDENYLILIDRHGYLEEVYVTFSFAPIRDANGIVIGVHNTAWDTTKDVVAERRMRALRALAAQIAGAASSRQACEFAATALASDSADVPFILFYLLDDSRRQATLAASTGLDPGSFAAPRLLDAEREEQSGEAWPLSLVLREEKREPGQSNGGVLLEDLADRFRGLPPLSSIAGSLPPRSAFLLPLHAVVDELPIGVLVLGLSPHRPFDDLYRTFLDLIAAQVGAGIAQAQARQRERERMERLAEIDRAKTEFFQNVSHEFRTPLTLMLAPLEDALQRRSSLPSDLANEIGVAARNGRRLLSLVNTLLDFSQLETGRLKAHFEPTDLAALTADIVSLFRTAAEQAGLVLRVDCPPLSQPAWVDRGMWEQVVSNLLSNALKFTFEGEIVVELRTLSQHVELVVRDTGVGIPEAELPNIFKRFHRVQGARARTHEGSGIGLAFVDALVRQHQGRIRVKSREGEGTTFTVWIPLLRRPGVPRSAEVPKRPPTAEVAAALAEEAARWVAQGPQLAEVVEDSLAIEEEPNPKAHVRGARILVVEDNNDLRAYLARLLAPHWNVQTAADGVEALNLIRANPPDLILADVMMPNLDGCGLLRAVREDEAICTTPVVLVTARAGEEAAIEGLKAGADDYIAKPFSPRELIARVRSAIDRARAETLLRERAVWLRGQREALEAAMNDAPLEISLGALVNTAVSGLGRGTRAAFFLANDDRASLYHVVGMEAAYAEVVDGSKIGPESLACRLATHTGEPVITPDVLEDPLWERWRWMAERFDYRGCWSFPIYTSGEGFVGTFAVYSQQPRATTERDLELISLLTHTASIIISRYKETVARQRVETALRESEQKYRTLFDSIDEGFCIIEMIFDEEGHAIDFSYVEANEGFERQTGRKPKRGQTMREVFPEAKDMWLDTYAEVVRTGIAKRFIDYNEGLGRWYDVYVFPTDAPKERMQLAALFSDVTDRKRAEQALRESEEKYRTLFDSIDEGYLSCEVIFDENDKPVDILYLDANPAAVRLAGRDFSGRRIREIDPHYEEYWYEIVGRVALTGESVRAEHYAEPHARWFDFYAVKVGGQKSRRVAIVFQDTTDRKHEEERQAFLLRFSDALRAQPNEQSIKDQTVKMLAEHLRLDRCYINEVSEQQAFSTLGPEQIRPDLPPMTGMFQLSDYPEIMRQLAIQPMVVRDAASDPRLLDSEKKLLAGLHLRALLVAPLRKGDGQVIWTLAAAVATPRDWTDGERVLLGEVGERARVAIERARGEAALRESEARFRALVNASSDIVYKMSADWSLMHQLIGKAFIVSTKAPSANWLEQYIPPNERARVHHAIAAAIQTKSIFELEHQVYRADKTIGWTFSRAIPLLDEYGQIVEWFGAASDVTERKRTEEALRVSEEKYRALFNSMDEAYAVVEVLADEHGRWNDFLFLEVNPAFMEHTGMEYPVGRTASQLLGTPNPRWVQLYGQVAETGEAVRVEETEFTLDRVFDLNIFRLGDSGSRRIAVLFTNITERKRVEQALRASEAELRVHNEELERFNTAMVGRELRMIELKQEINALRERIGEAKKFQIDDEITET